MKMKQTRFFETSGNGFGYYSLIKAVDEAHALEIYDSQVSTIDDKKEEQMILNEMTEITLSDTIKKMQEFTGENDELIPDGEILEQLADDELQLLGVDASLM